MYIDFKNYLWLKENLGDLGSVIMPSSWMHDIGRSLPQMDLGLPTITKSGTIDLMIKNKNPIFVQLSDGSKLFFTHDEFKRIDGEPERGRKMTIVFQRLSNDTSKQPSQIIKCKVS